MVDPKPFGQEKWFAVTLLFKSVIGGTPSLRPLCEERVVLFRGEDERGVLTAARRYAQDEEHFYDNSRRERVDWSFVRIERVEALEPPSNGQPWEIASRYVRRSLTRLRNKDRHPGAGRV